MQTSRVGYRRGGPLERAAATGISAKKSCSTEPSSTERHSEVLHGLLQLVFNMLAALLAAGIWIADSLNSAVTTGMQAYGT